MWRGCAPLLVALLVLDAAAVSAGDEDPEDEERPAWLVPTLHTAGLLATLRIGASLLWRDSFSPFDLERNAETFARSWSRPPELGRGSGFFQWDGDPWALNLIGHGLMGSEIYLRHRQGRHAVGAAAVLLCAWTILWEYVIEAWHKHPSGIDLIWTPAGGVLLGEGRYQLCRLIRRLRPSPGRQVLFYVIDPLGQLERDLLGLRF